jgi:adenylate cyclase
MAAATVEGEQPTQVLRDTIKRLHAMCQVSTALGAITEHDELVYKIIDCVFEIFPAVERALLMLYDPVTNDLVPVASRTWQEVVGSQGVVVMPRTVINEVVTHKRAVLSLDALDDTRFNNHTSVLNLSIRSIMCVPLVFREELVGLIHVDTRTKAHNFTSEDLQMLTGIAAQAAIAMKTLQLHEAIEAESARRASLQRYFSPPLVAMLMSAGVSPELGGNLYRGTILFADIIGFTAMSERVTPAQIVTKLNRYFTIMQKVIYENRGNVDKFGGDAIMAFWGVPHATAQDEHDAVLTAIQMQEKLWPFNLEMSSEGQQPIHMGLGLHSGEFIAGNIGSEDKIDFTLIGDTVNLAARIECLAGRYQVFVSEATWRAIRPLACAVQLLPVLMKGKAHPVTVYSIRAIHDRCRGGYAMALPCQVANAHGQHVGHGMVTYWLPSETQSTIHVNTDTPLTTGMTYVVHCQLPEYHEALTLDAVVETVVAIRGATLCPYTQATLRTIARRPAQAFFTPGSCVQTTRGWENLERL